MYIDHGAFIELAGQFIPPDPANTDYARFRAWLAAGNTAGVPVPATVPEMAARVREIARQMRGGFLSTADWVQLTALTEGRTADAQAIETIKQGMRDITKLPLETAASVEEMRAMVLARFNELKAIAPAGLKAAFLEAFR